MSQKTAQGWPRCSQTRAFAGLAGESQARNPKSRVKAGQCPLNRHAGLVSASSFCRTVAFSDTGTRSTWPALIAEIIAIRSPPAARIPF